MKKLRILIAVFFITSNSCAEKKDDMIASDIELYKETPAWELAQNVKKEDTNAIREILFKDTFLINYQEPKFKQSLLSWAVYTDHFLSTKVLAELGADPNLQDIAGTSAFILSADKYETSDYLRLLLRHGGDINAVAKIKDQQLKTPLIAAAFNRLESVKLLVNAGADINYVSSEYESALQSACLGQKIDIIEYLIIEKKIDYKKAIGYRAGGDSSYVREWIEKMDFPQKPELNNIKIQVLKYMQTH